MKTQKKFEMHLLTSLLCLCGVLLFVSCEDEAQENPVASFTIASANFEEGDGEIEIEVNLTSSVSKDTDVSFDLGGTAYLNGDYRLLTASPLTISKGNSSATIKMEIIDEQIIEIEEDELKITLTSIGSGSSLSANEDERVQTLTIQDNDTAPLDGLQFDLWWNLGEAKDVDEVDLDIFLATDVVIESNVVTDFLLFNGSENDTGFETLVLGTDEDDNEYYLVVYYKEGAKEVSYTLNLNGADYNNESITETFSSGDEGYAVFFGPISKSGTNFGRTAHHSNTTQLKMWWAK